MCTRFRSENATDPTDGASSSGNGSYVYGLAMGLGFAAPGARVESDDATPAHSHRTVSHQIVEERSVEVSFGSGYLIVCSCGQLIEIPPDPLTALTIAKAHAHHEWGMHHDRLGE